MTIDTWSSPSGFVDLFCTYKVLKIFFFLHWNRLETFYCLQREIVFQTVILLFWSFLYFLYFASNDWTMSGCLVSILHFLYFWPLTRDSTEIRFMIITLIGHYKGLYKTKLWIFLSILVYLIYWMWNEQTKFVIVSFVIGPPWILEYLLHWYFTTI